MDDVLEKMFFIRGPSDSFAPQQLSEVVAGLSFEGNPPGWLTLELPGDAARLLTASFLGQEETEVSPQEVGEVVCELANIICGATLSRVESETTFRLSEPRLLIAGERPGGCGTAMHAVRIGSGTLVVNFKMEECACPCSSERAS